MKKLGKIVGVVLLTVVLLIILAVVRLHFAKQYVVLNGPSMEPTINSGQKLSVQPYTTGTTPQRGDIVEYQSSAKLVQQYAKSETLLHRVIALPGERITIKNDTVLVYNTQHPNGFNPDTAYLASNVVTAGNADLTLTPGNYFVMGDNRPNALDSRAIGPIPLKDIIGRVSL